MDILYLSSLCSVKEYERMFAKYKSTSSHASQKFNRLIVKGLVENGCKVDALTQRIIVNGGEDDLKRGDEVENGVHFKYIPRDANKLKNRLITMIYAFWNILKWVKAHPDGRIICDIILGEMSLALWIIKIICPKIKTSAIVTDVPSIRAGEKRKGIKAIPLKIKNKAMCFYDSYIFLTEQMNAIINRKRRPYIVIEGIVDEDVLKKPNLYNEKYTEKVCIMAGLLEDIYGVDSLLKAFKKISCNNAKLLFYGKGSSVEAIKKAGVHDSRIHYCGEVTNQEIVKKEKNATLLINPRPPIGEWTAYSFPSKNMEYISSGTPLLAYDLPCIPEEYKKFFYIVTPPNEKGLEETLNRLLNTDTLELHHFGCEAQNWIVQEKCSSKQSKKIINMLKII